MTLIASLALLTVLQAQPAPVQPEVKDLPTVQKIELPAFDSHSCTPARIVWIDAMIKIKATAENVNLTSQDIENEIPGVITFGCANATDSAVVVIHSFVRGQPDDYLVIPKGWITSIIPFQVPAQGK